MLSPRWRKLAGDIAQAQGRLLMMVIAITVGVFAVAAISTSYILLKRDIASNYLATNPAAAILDVKNLDADVLTGVRAQAGITGAEAGGLVTGRVEVHPHEWLPLLLIVSPELGRARIGTVRLEAGSWPSTPEGVVLERTAVPVANTAIGSEINVQMPHGAAHSLIVTGVVHDPSLAPAWQEQAVYGYAAPATLSLLGEDSSLHSLKVTVKDAVGDRARLERTVVGVAGWLRRTGRSVGEIRIPPYRHPHEGMMTSVVRMLLAFGVLTLVLSAILTATLTTSLLAPQVRQIGVMKVVGARSAQIMQIYAALIAAIGAVAVGIGLPLGIDAGRALAADTAKTLNLEPGTPSLPFWVYAVQVLLGVGLPLVAALLPIKVVAGRSVRETLDEFGARYPAAAQGRLVLWASRLCGGDIAFSLIVRNSVRVKGRLALTLGLLAIAGALFMTSMNVRSAWQRTLAEAEAERRFDVEAEFAHYRAQAAALSVVSALPGVRRVEPWSAAAVSLARADGLSIVRTYPDGGHGSLQLQGVPQNSAFLTPALIAGRWLDAGNADAAVVNEQALSMFPNLRIGDQVQLNVHDHATKLRLIGIVREHLAQATIYASVDRFAEAVGEPGRIGGIRVALGRSDPRSADEVITRIENALDRSGSTAARVISKAQLRRVLGGHLFILIFILIVMSILMAIVGVMGLGSAMSISVLERTREFAVMRVVGARAGRIRRGVLGEAVFIGLLSACIASLLSVPLTLAVVRIVGATSLDSSIGLAGLAPAMSFWLVIVTVSAAAASLFPAWNASRLTIREALAYQ